MLKPFLENTPAKEISIAGYCSPIDSGKFPTGVGQHIRAMFSGLASSQGCNFSLLSTANANSSIWPEYARDVQKYRLPLGDAFSRLLLVHTPLLSIDGARLGIDWVYCPKEQPVKVKKAKLAVTCHDVRFFEGEIKGLPYTTTWRRAMFVRSCMKKIVRRADLILTVSDFTKSRLQELFGVSDDRIAVVGNGISPAILAPPPSEAESRNVLAHYGVESGAYLVAVGSLTRRKGGDAILTAASNLRGKETSKLKIIVAGRRHDEDLVVQWRKLPDAIRANILLPGYISDQELNVLYRRSLGLLFPSRYEGFGIPVVEAMACETRVICGQAAALKEICAGNAIEVDPNQPQSIVKAIYELLEEPPSQKLPILAAARDYASRYTWARCTAKLLDALRART